MQQRLTEQLNFIKELDRLKTVLRRNTLADGSRRENSAEHSWHICMIALVLAEHADECVDIGTVIQMLLTHDIVEIEAGDTFIYDEDATADKDEREQLAAKRLFGLLPSDQAQRLRALWEQFEKAKTPEAKFANAVDRLQPVLLNYLRNGGTWKELNVGMEQIIVYNRSIARASRRLWEHAEAMILEVMGES